MEINNNDEQSSNLEVDNKDLDLSLSVNNIAYTPSTQLDPVVLQKIAQVRSHIRESFGKVIMAMMVLPRYRQQSLADLQHLVLEPLIRDRIAIAYPGGEADPLADIAGLAIWASVSDEAEGRLREQIAAGVFPLRLKPDDWTSGPNNWLLDVIAPDARATANVIRNFKQVVKDGSLKLHPIVATLVDPETLRKMGATRLDGPGKAPPEGAPAMPEPVGTA